jgi:adenylate kinase
LQEITIELLKDAMLKHPESRGFLIDGFPRELDQGYQFEQEVIDSF